MRILVLIVTFLLFLTGCNNNDRVAENQNNNVVNVKNSNIPEVDRQTGQEVAQHLVKLTTAMPNIKDATAVVIGRYALVGIDVDENIDRSQVGSIKYTVAEALKKDPHGARAVVIADPDLTARLREVADDIERGEPIQGVVNELADISGRLMPEIPADIVDPQPKNATEKPDKSLNKSEQSNLEKKQQEQSNHHKD
jgi:YhcN/YlaJ family sporulation lipoprotein